MHSYLLRQSDLIDTAKVQRASVCIVGAGAVGSWTALALAKMGVGYIRVYDDDFIGEENMNCQFFPISSIGERKVDALDKMVHSFTDRHVHKFPERIDKIDSCATIYILAVDSMEVRKKLAESIKDKNVLVIDPRMGAEALSVYTSITGTEGFDAYKRVALFSDEDALQERCTAKSTIYCANVIAGIVCSQVKRRIQEQAHIPVISLDLSGEKRIY